MLTEDLASAFARVALAGTEREHPLHWLLVRVLRLYPMLPENGRIAALLDDRLSASAIDAERRRFEANPEVERPYGWAWLLELQAEALRMKARWSRTLAPLAQHLAATMGDFVSLPEPIRAGNHDNTAFACILALDYARASGDLPLELAIRKAARRWYGADRDAPLAGELSLDDFLSPPLVEAVLMQRLLDPAEFGRWLNGFLPSGIGPLAEPPQLSGLCFSRAWCFGALGLQQHAERHLAAALPNAAGGNYPGERRFASFAVLALSGAALKTP